MLTVLQAQLRQMRTLVQSMGWGPFMRHVGSLMAEQADATKGDQSSALANCSRTIHCLDKFFTRCGSFEYPADMVEPAAVEREGGSAMSKTTECDHEWVDDYFGDCDVPGGQYWFKTCRKCGCDGAEIVDEDIAAEREGGVMTTQADLINELRGTKCRCGKTKTARQTFCKRCYYSLPQSIRSALYKMIGEGYEEAYSTAVRLLDAADEREGE